MNISEYRRWYEIIYCQSCALTDHQLQSFPYFLEITEKIGHFIHDLSTNELKPNRSLNGTIQTEIAFKSSLKSTPHSLRMGGVDFQGFLNGDSKKESPLSITSGLLRHGVLNHD